MLVGSGGQGIAISLLLFLIKFRSLLTTLLWAIWSKAPTIFNLFLKEIPVYHVRNPNWLLMLEHFGSNSCELYQIRAGTCSIVVLKIGFLKKLQLGMAFCHEQYQLGFQN